MSSDGSSSDDSASSDGDMSSDSCSVSASDDGDYGDLAGEEEAQFNDIDGLLPDDSELGEAGTYVQLDGAECDDNRQFYGDDDHSSNISERFGRAKKHSHKTKRDRIMAPHDPSGSSQCDDSQLPSPFINATVSEELPRETQDPNTTGEQERSRSLVPADEDTAQRIRALELRIKKDLSHPQEAYLRNRTYGTMPSHDTLPSVEEEQLCWDCFDFFLPAVLAPTPRYTALPGPSSLRVIAIYPGRDDDVLTGTLDVLDLDDPGAHYEAISYRWGCPNGQLKPMILSGRRVYINSTLSAILLSLRLRTRVRILWADALCINQADHMERRQQVGMMQRIYSRASRVIIHLRGYNNHVRECFLAIKDLASAWITFQKGRNGHDGGHASSNNIFGNVMDNVKMGRIAEVFKNCYWTRLWVVQEVVSARAAVVHWNGEVISWTLVGLATTLIRNNEGLWKDFTSVKMSQSSRAGLMNAYLMYRLPSPRFRSNSLSFLDLLRLTRSFKVTEPLDRIYATLGLPSRQTGHERTFISPDYRLLQRGLYTRVFYWVVNTHETPLEILSAVRHTAQSIPSFPTWIPQWHVDPIRSIASSHHRSMKFDASKGWPSKPLLQVCWKLNERNLTLEGFIIGTITSSQEILPPSLPRSGRTRTRCMIEHKQGLITWITQQFPASEHVQSRMSLTLTAGQDWYGTIVQGQAALERHRSCFQNWTLQHLSGQELDAGSREDAKKYGRGVQTVCRGRKLFAAAGCQMGLGPETLMPGDTVCVLLGGPVPYILRSLGSNVYHFVGECYVPDYMFGEAIVEWTTPTSTSLNPHKFILK
ncbi:heterokaryon incompatibility protein-domain-containing protein [Ilyonectria robusta]|uniref:heterokaryon incompatibility protein-domain-containing protein n=1 Tax=Ilyonectria robusta TaxID=1079257 RepID=UPI001E8E3632|nr:heterokaryon incompatibility protein-domain-containing protein [Ilyonectria robusta]KAH8679397.1 heterokaryon incompatibility protein-domain-containing protein [Ilyonectria robusta]